MDLTTGCQERPWGFYQQLTTAPSTHAVKRLVVYPGRRLSLQRHRLRSEHWYVVHGTGVALVGDVSWPVSRGDAVDVPVGAWHRLSADDGPDPLVVIEVQLGSVLSEDDIERLEDDYGRVRKCSRLL